METALHQLSELTPHFSAQVPLDTHGWLRCLTYVSIPITLGGPQCSKYTAIANTNHDSCHIFLQGSEP